MFDPTLYLFNGILIVFALMFYYRKKQDPSDVILLLGKIILIVFICLLSIELIMQTSDIFQMVRDINYYIQMRYFLINSIFLTIGIILAMKLFDTLVVFTDKQKLNRSIILTFVGISIFIIYNEFRYFSLLNNSYQSAIHEMIGQVDLADIRGSFILGLDIVLSLTIFALISIYKKNIIKRKWFITGISISIGFIITQFLFFLNPDIIGNMFFAIELTDNGLSGTSDVINELFVEVLEDDYLRVTIVFMLIGSFPRALGSDNSTWIGLSNLAITFMPTLMWLLVFTDTTRIPSVVFVIFSGYEFFGYIFYLMLLGSIYLLVISIIMLYTGFGSILGR